MKLHWYDFYYDPKGENPFVGVFMISSALSTFSKERLCRVLKKEKLPEYGFEDAVAEYLTVELRRRLNLPVDDDVRFVKGDNYTARPYIRLHRDYLKHLFLCMEICLDAGIAVFTQGVLAGWWFEPSDLPEKGDASDISSRWSYEIAERAIVRNIMEQDRQTKKIHARLNTNLCKPTLMITEEGKNMARELRRLGNYHPIDGDGSDDEAPVSHVAPRMQTSK